MASSSKSTVFETTAETYLAGDLVGEGRNGRVFKVTDSTGKPWALKCLRPDQATATQTRRFLNELEFCRTANHKNVVTVLDQGFVLQDGKKCPFYVMPLYNSTLRKLIRSGVVPDKVLKYFSQLLDGVEAAHLKGVWHRDLKPENILHDSAADMLVVSDFGVAHFAEEAMHTTVETRHGERLANFQYSAPEQRARGANVDSRADTFALGLILNEMFTGQVIQGTGYKTIGEVAPAHAYLDEIVDQMVRQAPVERPCSIDEIKQILIGKKNEFVSRQKLDELRKTVVPAGTVDDPIVRNPVKPVDIDVQGSTLVIVLNQNVTPNWVRAFHSIGSYGFFHGCEPTKWKFQANKASVEAPRHVLEGYTQQLIDYFGQYVEKANEAYGAQVERAMRQQEESTRQALQERIAEEERRQRILSSVKIVTKP